MIFEQPDVAVNRCRRVGPGGDIGCRGSVFGSLTGKTAPSGQWSVEMEPALQVGTEDERRNRVVSLKSLVATVVLLGVDGPSPTGAGIAPCCRECDREILRGLPVLKQPSATEVGRRTAKGFRRPRRDPTPFQIPEYCRVRGTTVSGSSASALDARASTTAPPSGFGCSGPVSGRGSDRRDRRPLHRLNRHFTLRTGFTGTPCAPSLNSLTGIFDS